MATAALTRYTPEEYLALERNAEFKSEYIDGRIVAMSGATEPHVTIVGNIAAELRTRLRGGPCRAYASEMRVQIAGGRRYTYPDVVAVCGERQFIDGVMDTLSNPVLIFEVLSPSTEAYDRAEKFHHYQLIESLQEYILVAQDQPRVECYTRGPGGDVWYLWTETDLDKEVEFYSVGCRIPLREIYENVDSRPRPPADARGSEAMAS
jgi:Uma2 family endonuclease